jgi:hypothetical protein
MKKAKQKYMLPSVDTEQIFEATLPVSLVLSDTEHNHTETVRDCAVACCEWHYYDSDMDWGLMDDFKIILLTEQQQWTVKMEGNLIPAYYACLTGLVCEDRKEATG